MKKMTKNQFREFAAKHGCSVAYYGKQQKFFITKHFPIKADVLHGLINSR